MTETNKSSNIQSLASDLAVVRDFLDRAEPPEELSEFERKTLLDQIKNLLLEKNAKLVVVITTHNPFVINNGGYNPL